MNEEMSKNKLKMNDIVNEITNIKKYNNDLANNLKGDKLEEYLDKLNKDIIKAQDKIENIYTINFK